MSCDAAYVPIRMILSCPNCATQYKVNDAVIGVRGRTVRCAACKQTWHADTPIDLRYSEGRPKELEEEPKEDLRTVKAKKLPGKYRAMLEDKKRMQALMVEGLVWGGMGAMAVLVLAIGYFLRVDIVKAFPRIAGAYAMVGLKTSGTNLEFGTHTGDVDIKGGRFIVTVKAQVNNTSDQPEPVPPVRVKLYDSTLQAFGDVLMPSGGLIVAPHATRTLTFDVPDPMNKVASMDLEFDLVAMKKMRGQAGKADNKPHEDTAKPGASHEEAAPAPAPEGEAHHAEAALILPADGDSGAMDQDSTGSIPGVMATEEQAAKALSARPLPRLRGALSSTAPMNGKEG